MAKVTAKNGNSIIKRFIGNKNTVTIIGFLACILTLVIGYNIRVRDQISPVSLPYATKTIPPKTLITNAQVGKIKISSSYTNDVQNVVKDVEDVVNKYSTYKSAIPKGSLFYKEELLEADEMPDAAFAKIANDYTIYSLAVDADSTFANSIREGDYIDLYLSSQTDDEDEDAKDKLIIYGCLIKSIRVLAVKDSSGNNILRNSLAYGTPSELLFAVDNDMFKLLKIAEIMKYKISPLIRNKQYTVDGDKNATEVDSIQLQEFITQNIGTIE